ncbi:MAG: hypothetical protein HY928_05610 [Elusimicrobia bacterium]|nr:hypothetical protein [Elusimicrobiota bacterium]
MPDDDRAGFRRELALVALVLVVLRFAGAHYGLPGVFNADEPHHVNIAVSFGRGSLNPGMFKYPTLWMYVLFGAYGLFFLGWSGLGLRAGVRAFGHLFAWKPAAFYLIGRLLAGAASVAAAFGVLKASRTVSGARAGLWAFAVMAASYPATELAWSCKPDSLMLALSAFAWERAVSDQAGGGPAALRAAALLTGLAVSTQYTAAPLAAAPVLAALLFAPAGGKLRALAETALLGAAGFALGSPYALVERAALLRDLGDHVTVNFYSDPIGLRALGQLGWFSGFAPLSALLVGAGAVSLWRRAPRLALLLCLPPALHLLSLMRASTGMLERYFFASVPAAAMLAAEGVEALARALKAPLASPASRAAVLALLLLPGAGKAAALWRDFMRPDTRLAAARWVEANIPAGTALVIGDETDNPPLKPSRENLERLLAKARSFGHPKARLFELMLEAHPGGGYDIFRMSREALSIDTGPEHRRLSEEARETIPVSGGLAALRAKGVTVAVFSTYGIGRVTPDYKRFVEEVVGAGHVLAEFEPAGGLKGPRVRVVSIAPAPSRG